MTPLVSILIPAFNAETFIAQTLRSATAQTWPRKEIIVVDDGSTDGTLAVARHFASKQVSVVTQKNQGAAAARNAAFALSQGDYIQWLDADDVLAPEKIATQLAALGDSSTKKTLLSGPWGHFLYRVRRAKFSPSPLWADLTPLEWLLRKMEHDTYMQTATWLVSRELTETGGPWDTRLLGDDDGEYFCRVLSASDGVRFVDNARTYYRISGSGSLSFVGDSDRKLAAQCLSCRLHVDYVLKLGNSERSRAACVRYLQKYVPMFYGRQPELEQELQRIAASLGGSLHPPTLPRKYAWLQRLVGWTAATRSRRIYNTMKWSVAKAYDRQLFALERTADALLP